ncbi:fumarylacetoacetate hydrolase family protein [Quatrionicoccus australiensis]|uniref:fumarylacetoacetate hydrolase family protein n=1 Tax=Quatrionicoccus australiensis TaxID=138118 RepID=UPI001CFC1757|nr:fumarylacetoacetate hydrolase family protein [Quatrionicoccus australiensis]MCB4358744.1 fumarylacetoacetate hydrolase family protein [Quatrionicoccus australiensis]
MIKQQVSGTVYGVILNDAASVQKIGSLEEAPYKGAPKAPALYIKPANTRAACGAAIDLPGDAKTVEVAATIGLVMGRAAGRLTAENALDAVAGIVLAADLSLPHASYYRPAIREKCFDGSLPLSSVKPLVDLSNLVLNTEIDGKVVDTRSLAGLIRQPAQLLADVTEFMSLRQGDVLLVGVSYQAPQAAAGSKITLSADGVGSLSFTIAGAQA